MSQNYTNIIFDFDGTLADTAPDIIGALRKSYLDVLNREVVIQKSVIGPTADQIFRQLTPELEEDKIDLLIKAFRKNYDNCNFEETYLYPGVQKMLEVLKNQGRSLYIVTNKPALATKRILEGLKIEDFFPAVISPDSEPSKKMNKSEMITYLLTKENLSQENSVMVGDVPADIEAAKMNGLKSVAVLSGYGKQDALKASKPDWIIDHISQLTEFI